MLAWFAVRFFVYVLVWLAFSVGTASVCAAPSAARADASLPSAADESGDDAEANELARLLREAVQAYDAGDLLSARARFQAVHERAPTARTLRSLGLVAYRQARYADAVALLEDSLGSRVRPLTEDQRTSALALLAEARDKAEDQHAQAAAITPAKAARAEQGSLTAPAVPAAPSALPAQVSPPLSVPRAASPSPASPRARRIKRASYTLMALGSALLVVSAGSYLTGIKRVREIETYCRKQEQGSCTESIAEGREVGAHLSMLSRLSLASAIAGSLTAAGGVGLWLVPRSAQSEPHAALLGVCYRTAF